MRAAFLVDDRALPGERGGEGVDREVVHRGVRQGWTTQTQAVGSPKQRSDCWSSSVSGPAIVPNAAATPPNSSRARRTTYRTIMVNSLTRLVTISSATVLVCEPPAAAASAIRA